MGEAKRRRRAHQKVFEKCPNCIYCGGENPATTVEHMPPRMMFRGKERPKGLEFASCCFCNEGTRHADLIASTIGRVFPDSTTEMERAEYKQLIKAIKNNVPKVLEEMWLEPKAQAFARTRLPTSLKGGVLRVDGPLVSAYMEAFAAKVGFALHYEASGQILPNGGVVFARWYSNVDQLEGRFPTELTAMLPPPQTLRQGKKEVSDQFQYSFKIAEDHSIGAYVATFRYAFAVIAMSALDEAYLRDKCPFPRLLWEPGEIVDRLHKRLSATID